MGGIEPAQVVRAPRNQDINGIQIFHLPLSVACKPLQFILNKTANQGVGQ